MLGEHRSGPYRRAAELLPTPAGRSLRRGLAGGRGGRAGTCSGTATRACRVQTQPSIPLRAAVLVSSGSPAQPVSWANRGSRYAIAAVCG